MARQRKPRRIEIPLKGTVAPACKVLRGCLGLTQMEAAAQAGMVVRTVRRAENAEGDGYLGRSALSLVHSLAPGCPTSLVYAKGLRVVAVIVEVIE